MTTPNAERALPLLQRAARAAGLSPAGAEPIRLAENDLWRLPGGTVVRISRPGQFSAAAREVAVTRWLAIHDFSAVRPLPIPQPVRVDERAATFWTEIPPHHHGTATDLAPLLRRLHNLPTPDHLDLGQTDPFVRIFERLTEARTLADNDRSFLLARLDTLLDAWQHLPQGRATCVVHGDAWGGNCAVTTDGRRILMDFERTSRGHPEWDLTSPATAMETTGTLTEDAYTEFCTAYGYDVRQWDGYPTLRAIRELRMATFAVQITDQNPDARPEAEYRISCLRGNHGPRPWHWSAVS